MDIQTLHGLLYGFDVLADIHSKSQTNEWDFRPRILPIDVGKGILLLEGAAEHFKIFFYTSHCEVWPTKDWLSSLSFRETLKGLASKDIAQRDRYFSLIDALSKRTGLSDKNTLANLAAMIEDNTIGQLVLIFRIGDIVKAYNESKIK